MIKINQECDNMRKTIEKIPIPMAGLMLGVAALGNLVQSYGDIYRNILGVMSGILLLLLIAKIVVDPEGIKKNMNNAVVASASAPLPMGIILLATFVKPYFPSFSYVMWITGLILNVLLILYFTKKYVFNFSIKNVFPSWFVLYIGIVIGSVTAPAYDKIIIGQYLFWFGFVCYLILLPIVLYRVIKIKGIPEPALPTIGIFAAPASLCLVGYMNSFQDKNVVIVGFLAALSLIIYIMVLLQMPILLKLPFYPSVSSYTFPFVISGIAIKLTDGFLVKSNNPIYWLKYVVKFQEFVAVLFIFYVSIIYIKFLLTEPKRETAKAQG